MRRRTRRGHPCAWALVAGLAWFVAAPASERDRQALVITQGGRPADCLSPTAIYEIDGKLASVSSQGFYLDPGVHRLRGQSTVRIEGCPVVRGRNANGVGIRPLEAEFEAGMTYWIGLDHGSKNSDDWRLVIWKMERRADGSE